MIKIPKKTQKDSQVIKTVRVKQGFSFDIGIFCFTHARSSSDLWPIYNTNKLSKKEVFKKKKQEITLTSIEDDTKAKIIQSLSSTKIKAFVYFQQSHEEIKNLSDTSNTRVVDFEWALDISDLFALTWLGINDQLEATIDQFLDPNVPRARLKFRPVLRAPLVEWCRELKNSIFEMMKGHWPYTFTNESVNFVKIGFEITCLNYIKSLPQPLNCLGCADCSDCIRQTSALCYGGDELSQNTRYPQFTKCGTKCVQFFCVMTCLWLPCLPCLILNKKYSRYLNHEEYLCELEYSTSIYPDHVKVLASLSAVIQQFPSFLKRKTNKKRLFTKLSCNLKIFFLFLLLPEILNFYGAYHIDILYYLKVIIVCIHNNTNNNDSSILRRQRPTENI